MSRLDLLLPGDAVQQLYTNWNRAAMKLNKESEQVLYIDDFGASKTGGDNTAILREIIREAEVGATIKFGPTSGTQAYTFLKEITVDKRIHFEGAAGRSKIVLTQNYPWLNLIDRDRFIVRGFAVFGSGKSDATKAAQMGIYNYQSSRNLFENLYFEGISGAGILSSDNYSTDDISQHKGSLFSDIILFNNNYGIAHKGRSEYNTMHGIKGEYNKIVIYDDSGNNNLSAFTMSWNEICYQIRASSNTAHGQITGGNMNHAYAYSLDIDDAYTGMKITSVSFFDAPFRIFGISKLVILANCLIDTSGGNFDESTCTGNGLEGSSFYSASTDPRTVITGTNGAKFFVKDMKNPAGLNYNFGTQGFGSLNDRVTTTNATLTTIKTLPMVASTLYQISGKITARRTGGASGTADDIAVFKFEATYIVISGTLTERAKTITVVYRDDAAMDFQLNISSLNLLLQVQGVASNNYTWNLQDLQIEETTT